LVFNNVDDVVQIRIYDVVLYEFIWDQKQSKPVSSKAMMIIVQQQSGQGEFNERWKIMIAEGGDNKLLIGE
jgi:hypothetical protein